MEAISRKELAAEVNDGVIEYLEELGKGPGVVHPDVEERMKELSQNLKGMSLWRYRNAIIIKTDQSSTIVAVAFGTAYSIKIGSMLKEAVSSGAKTYHRWSGGGSLDLVESFGHDWIAGAWAKDETDWIRNGNA